MVTVTITENLTSVAMLDPLWTQLWGRVDGSMIAFNELTQTNTQISERDHVGSVISERDHVGSIMTPPLRQGWQVYDCDQWTHPNQHTDQWTWSGYMIRRPTQTYPQTERQLLTQFRRFGRLSKYIPSIHYLFHEIAPIDGVLLPVEKMLATSTAMHQTQDTALHLIITCTVYKHRAHQLFCFQRHILMSWILIPTKRSIPDLTHTRSKCSTTMLSYWHMVKAI